MTNKMGLVLISGHLEISSKVIGKTDLWMAKGFTRGLTVACIKDSGLKDKRMELVTKHSKMVKLITENTKMINSMDFNV